MGSFTKVPSASCGLCSAAIMGEDLFTALVSLVMVVEGPTRRSGLYLNVGLWVVLLLGAAQTSRLLSSKSESRF